MSTRNARVLLVEHYQDLLSLNELILQAAGYQPEPLPAGQDPVDYAARTRPDAIVVNIRPTEPRDWNVIDRLDANPQTSTIPVVAMSTSPRVATEAQAAPVVRATVVMPYDIEALRQAVARALGNPPPAAAMPPLQRAPSPAVATAGQLLNEHSRQIALRAIRRLQELEPFKSRFAELSPGLVDNLPLILGAITTGLSRNLTPDDVTEAPQIRDAICEHAALRARQELHPSALIHEYEILNDEIFGFLRGQVGRAQFSAMDAFDIARTISAFTAQVLRISVNRFLALTIQRTSNQ